VIGNGLLALAHMGLNHLQRGFRRAHADPDSSPAAGASAHRAPERQVGSPVPPRVRPGGGLEGQEGSSRMDRRRQR
jgi:hypothetical protein